MKILKWILIVVAVIVIIPLLAAAFMKKDYTIVQEVVINKPKQQVFDYVKYVDNQNKFNKWVLADPAIKIVNKGTDGTVGFVQSWDSKEINSKGEQEIKQIVEGEKIESELRFEKPFPGVSPTSLQTASMADNQTKVTWTFHGHMSWPLNIMRPMAVSMMNTDLQESLGMLKKQLEQ
ncbi:SRPBCC family protein [Chitinophaga horti]|uniref:SRPBCC family protein n=1 Tax=Chitinophaga horti TaxID=2920382 RepID=A0ABY6J8A0_9BACT|nr:SRPBCC family protein [Chitinophaga horti]UYQ95918.1 SRPBCC family protein [Chitinophaga horti]